MQKVTHWRNWLEALSLVSVLIYLSLIVLVWLVPNLSTSQEYRVFGFLVIIAMIPGFVSLRLRA